jgi:phenylacetic acid degradation operon negative regulatory protein
VWIAPAHLADEAHDVLIRRGLSDYVDLFIARHLGFSDLAEEITRWWNLDQIQDSYAAYLDAWWPVLERWRKRRQVDPQQAFTDYMNTLTAWRRLPYLDPGPPGERGPRVRNGAAGPVGYIQQRDRLAEPAHEYLDRVRG